MSLTHSNASRGTSMRGDGPLSHFERLLHLWFCCIPAVKLQLTAGVDVLARGGGREPVNPVEPVLLRPIVESGVTRPAIVSWRLMSGAASEHASGSWERRSLGECGADLQGKWSGHKAGSAAQAQKATLSTFNVDP